MLIFILFSFFFVFFDFLIQMNSLNNWIYSLSNVQILERKPMPLKVSFGFLIIATCIFICTLFSCVIKFFG